MTNTEKELIEKISKKFQTTIIGSIARFEKVFGYLWEQDNADGDRFADMWEYARNSILNNGNKQSRNATNDIIEFFNKDQPKIKHTVNFKLYKGEDAHED